MADWSKPALESPYANFVAESGARDVDLAVAFDPARTNVTNFPLYAMRFRSAAKKWETWNGTAWADSTDAYAINISGTAANVTGIVAAAKGGTGQSGYVIGDLLYASGAATLSKLAAVATGNVLLSGGAATAPTWGKVGLTTHVSGVLGAANGGTGVATLTGVAYGNGAGAFTAATAAQLVAAIGATPVAQATAAANGGVKSVNGLTGDVVIMGVPPGAVMHFAMPVPPSGWLVADGTAKSRSTYAALFAAIGTTFGAGDGSTTFNLPNICGEFIRGYDNGRGVDPDRVFGSTQLDQMQRITASATFSPLVVQSASGAFIEVGSGTGGQGGSTTRSNLKFDSGLSPNARVSADTTGETRPRNIALLACIKF